jgi:hypothetical protein
LEREGKSEAFGENLTFLGVRGLGRVEVTTIALSQEV